ncbi:uncharacterized protein LOC131676022 [Topomyia yanbarensis]|uniref:uncharacterized protein LOC131676022 n=1 Tax=Topomyia yanbarensis TaxID=2498891 RepID=UPI00273B0F74|nr:uncharacterized protein LOC131676022 [Topomyia yanbarensis]
MNSAWKVVLFVISACLRGGSSFPHTQTVITQVPPPKVISVNKTSISLIDGDLKRIATIGILFGAVQGEAEMEKKLKRQLMDLSRTYNVTKFEVKSRKVAAMERTMERDRMAIGILNGALNLATKSMTYEQYKREMSKLSEREKQSLGTRLPVLKTNPVAMNTNQTDYDLKYIKRKVNRHINDMRKSLANKIKETVQYLERNDGMASIDQVDAVALKKIAGNRLPDYSFYESVFQQDLENHIEALFRRRQDDDEDNGNVYSKDSKENANQNDITVTLGDDEDESESEDEAPPGGLVGLIASLSGGDEGSDVGALVGALSAAITNLFGPDGLDVPGLLGTGTGLIAGLLGGDENFGKVLGGYVGIAVEGLSGGGADNNGAFFGNLLGAMISAFSSDPDDEDLPLRPELFIKNFFSGLQDAKRKGDPPADGCGDSCKGSDLFGFIGNIVSSIVGGVTSLVLNASLGSSGGSSQGSVDASGASSAGSSADDGCKHPCQTTPH